MKTKITITLLAIFSLSFNLFAADEPDSMYIHFTASDVSDSVVAFALSDVDSIVYYAPGVAVGDEEGGDEVAVGDYAYGGVVFYIFSEGETGYVADEQHGLVCAVSDSSDNGYLLLKWSTETNTTNATDIAIGTGQSNTNSIISSDGSSAFAAYYCDTLTMNGYDDWFLPSKDELNAMFNNKDAINTTADNNGGNSFSIYYLYWSSTEVDDDEAWRQIFGSGTQVRKSKDSPNCVRAIRAF